MRRRIIKIGIVGFAWAAALSGTGALAYAAEAGFNQWVAGILMAAAVSGAMATTMVVALWDAT